MDPQLELLVFRTIFTMIQMLFILIYNVMFPNDFLSDIVSVLNGPNVGLMELVRRDLEAEQRRPAARPRQGGRRISEAWLKSLSDKECRWWFRFTYDELVRLVAALRIPDPIRTRTRYCFSALEALCLLLYRFRSAEDLYAMTTRFDRSASSISEIINLLAMWLDERWRHLLDFDIDGILSKENIEVYANAISQAGSPMATIWALIDCTIRAISRPSLWQDLFYSGHKKFHALKFQSLVLPNGIIGHLFGPESGRRNDNYLLRESGLIDRLREHAVFEEEDGTRRYFQIYGDPAYGLNRVLMSPFSGAGTRTEAERDFNTTMSGIRMKVEHGYGLVINNWRFLDATCKHRLFLSPVGTYYRVAVLLTNALTCCHDNQISQSFDLPSPSLEEYFHH